MYTSTHVFVADVGQMSSEGSRLLQNMADRTQEKRFVRSVREVHDGVRDVKNILIAQPNISIKEPTSTSTPLTDPTHLKRGDPHKLSGKRIASNLSGSRQSSSTAKGASPARKQTGDPPLPATRKNISPVVRAMKPVLGQPLLVDEEVAKVDVRPFEALPHTARWPLQPVSDEEDDVDTGSSTAATHSHMPALIAREKGTQYEEPRRKGRAGGLARQPSYGEFGEGFSRSYTMGEAETQTPLARKRDEEVQTAKEERVLVKELPEVHAVAVRSKEPGKQKGEWAEKVEQ